MIEINDLQKHVAVNPDALAALAREVLRREGVVAASISLVLVDDAAIHAINRRELQHDWPTDVITFGLSGPEDDELAAELVVSGEMAATTARGPAATPSPSWRSMWCMVCCIFAVMTIARPRRSPRCAVVKGKSWARSAW